MVEVLTEVILSVAAVVLTVFVGRRLSLPAPAVAPMAGGDPRTISLPKAQE